MIVRRRGDWLTAKVGGILVMMSRQKISRAEVNEVGVRIWELIETPQDFDALCRQLQQEYKIPPEGCRPEVETFVTELAKRGVSRSSRRRQARGARAMTKAREELLALPIGPATVGQNLRRAIESGRLAESADGTLRPH